MKKLIFTALFLLLFATPVFGATITKTIGTDSRDYSTIQAWEDDLDDGTNAANDATAYQAGDDAVGEVYNDSVYDESVTIDGGGTVGLASITLTVPEGERHDGVAASAGGTPGARIVRTGLGNGFTLSSSAPVYLDWLEITSCSNAEVYGIRGTGGTLYVRQCIIHDVESSTSWNYAWGIYRSYTSSSTYLLNTIIYDVRNTHASSAGRVYGIFSDSVGPFEVYNCTIHDIERTDGTGNCYGVWFNRNDADTKLRNVISTDATQGCFYYAGTTIDDTTNLSSDVTADDGGGSGHLINKSSANQFVSTAGGSEDLHLKAGADAIDAGTDLGTSPTGVNFDIDNRNRDSEGDTWDMGADEYVAAVVAAGETIMQSIIIWME